jgi:hypothetical protein
MTKSSTRTHNNRRDRRKAKASDWRREGTKSGGKVGHHLSVSHVKAKDWSRAKRRQAPKERAVEPLRVPLAELCGGLKDD